LSEKAFVDPVDCLEGSLKAGVDLKAVDQPSDMGFFEEHTLEAISANYSKMQEDLESEAVEFLNLAL
jgi:hypothetical protein